MKAVPGILKGMAVLVAIVGIGVAIGVLSGNKKNSTPAGQPGAEAAQTNAAQERVVVAPIRPKTSQSSRPPLPHPVVPVATNASVPNPQNVITNWESKLDDILGSDADEKDKAKQLAKILPNLPEEGQLEAAQHLSNLVTDEDYGSIGRFMTDSALPESVLDIFLADSLNRPNAVKLPLLLDVAQDPQNPKAGEAKEILQLFLEEDYGNDWATWKTKVDEWIKNNPD